MASDSDALKSYFFAIAECTVYMIVAGDKRSIAVSSSGFDDLLGIGKIFERGRRPVFCKNVIRRNSVFNHIPLYRLSFGDFSSSPRPPMESGTAVSDPFGISA